jgi:hypothetical protein
MMMQPAMAGIHSFCDGSLRWQRTKVIPHGRIEVVDLDEPASVTRDVSPSWLHKGSAE